MERRNGIDTERVKFAIIVVIIVNVVVEAETEPDNVPNALHKLSNLIITKTLKYRYYCINEWRLDRRKPTW